MDSHRGAAARFAIGGKRLSSTSHVDWLSHAGQFKTAGGATVDVWDFEHLPDDATLSAWAAHFRNHYCLDADLPALVAGTGRTHAEFLTDVKFPSKTATPGPSVRSGDFAEILVADFVEFVMGYWCPRLRYLDRWNPNDSTKGTDVIAFWFEEGAGPTPEDRLYLVESKGALTGGPVNRLQDAINDSIKDKVREATSLSAMKQRLIASGRQNDAMRVQRFQNEADLPFVRRNAAAAVLDNGAYDETLLASADVSQHPNAKNLELLVIKGEALMPLAHALYERAANEA